jgi:hypothetical protein
MHNHVNPNQLDAAEPRMLLHALHQACAAKFDKKSLFGPLIFLSGFSAARSPEREFLLKSSRALARGVLLYSAKISRALWLVRFSG